MPNERRSQGCCCQKYVDAISRIARLEEDVARLKRENAGLREQLGKARRTALEKPFGESTSSASRLVKPSTPEPVDEAERMRRVGGATPEDGSMKSSTGRRSIPTYRSIRMSSATRGSGRGSG